MDWTNASALCSDLPKVLVVCMPLPSPPLPSPPLPFPPPQARSLGTKQISEDDLLEMIRSRPAGGTPSSPSVKEGVPSKGKRAGRTAAAKAEPVEDVVKDARVVALPPSPPSVGGVTPAPSRGCMLWVDKYRPTSLKGVIGQQGPRSCASKLLQWLKDWGRHHGVGSEGGAQKKPTGGWGESRLRQKGSLSVLVPTTSTPSTACRLWRR